MSRLLETLERDGLSWLAAMTALLALGSVCLLLARAPAHRQRIAELTVGATLCWLVLAFVPLPRLGLGRSPGAAEPARAAVTVAAVPELDTAWPRPPGEVPRSAAPPWPRPSAVAAEPAAEAAPSAVQTMSLAGLAARGYLLAAGLGAAYLVLAVVCLSLLRARTRPAEPALQHLVGGLAGGAVRRAPRVLVARRGTRPFCVGLGRGTIVLPECLLADEASARLASVVRHEVAHLARRDGAGRLLMSLALPLLWLHPLYWWLRREAQLAAELLADDAAAAAGDPAAYARDMIDLAAGVTARGAPLLAAGSAFRSRSEFFRRMQMLLERDGRLAASCSPFQRFAFTAVTLAALGLASASIGTGRLAAQEPTKRLREEERARKEQAQLLDERAVLVAELEKLRAEVADVRRATQKAKQADAEAAEVARSAEKYARRMAGRKELDEEEKVREALLERLVADKEAEKALKAAVQAARVDEETKPPADPGVFYDDGTDGTRRSAARRSPSHALTDAVGLVSQAIDLEGEIAITESKLGQASKLAEGGLTSREEVMSLEVRLKTLTRKRELVMLTLDAERKATKLSRQAVEEALKDVSPRQRFELEAEKVRLDARLKALSLPR